MGKKVFVLDHDASILEVIQTVLFEQGFEIKISNTLENFEENLKGFLPDAIFLDTSFLQKNNSIYSKLKNDDQFRKTPIILMGNESNFREKYAFLKAEAYLKKPFEVTQLADVAKRFTDDTFT